MSLIHRISDSKSSYFVRNETNIESISSEHICRLARMSVLDTEVDDSNPGSSMLFP